MNPRTFYDRLRKLEILGNITIESNSKFSLVTVMNWGSYQIGQSEPNTKPTTRQQQNDYNNQDFNKNANNKPTLGTLADSCFSEYESNEPNNKPTTNQQHANTNNKDNNVNKELYTRVTECLNQKAGTNYKPTTKSTQRVIDARINEGFSIEDMLKVIDIKTIDWKGTDYEKYLRPETLFGNKFEGYLNSKPKETKQQEPEFLNFMEDPDE